MVKFKKNTMNMDFESLFQSNLLLKAIYRKLRTLV